MINNTILYNSVNASVMYLKNREYIYIALEGFLNSESINGFNNALINGIKQSDAKKFLFDTSKINVIKSEEVQWLVNNIIPYLAKDRFSKIAFLKPENYFGNKSVESLSNALKDSISVKTFPNMEQAERWLFQS